MKILTRHLLFPVAVLAVILSQHSALAQTIYTQAVVGIFANGTNLVEKSATAAPNDATTFSNAVTAAYATNYGGVFDFPTAVVAGTTVYRGTYAGGTKRLDITSSVSMQNSAANGNSWYPVSKANLTTSSANQSSYRLAIGTPIDPATGLPLPNEGVSRIGLIILSRTTAAYPLDVQVTAGFSDGSTQAATANIANLRGTDDTFFGFTAPGDLTITNLLLQSFTPGTQTPVADRIGWDDLVFLTKPTNIPPPPVVYNVSPLNYAISDATNGVHFQVQSYVNLYPTNISLVLNSIDVSSQMNVTGDPTNLSVSFSNLLPNQTYSMTITATNLGGAASVARTFYTITDTFTLYDSQGFTNDILYPLGALLAVTNGQAIWTPDALEPAQIVNVGDPEGKVLQRPNTGATRADFLSFPPVSSGTITIEFDAWTSTTLGRTLDVCILPLGGGGTTMGNLLSWGQVVGKLAYFDNVNWLPITDWPDGWHHCKIINYLSGPAAGKYDVLLDGSPMAQRLPWRNAAVGAAFNRLRVESANTGPLFEYANIDNLTVTAGPADLNATLSPTILNLTPPNHAIVAPQAGIHFEVTSLQPISATNVTMLLNGAPVSLTITGSASDLLASYNSLSVGNYTVEIKATNGVGSTTVSSAFIATDEAWLLDPANGWLGPWQWTSGQPVLETTDPMDGTSPYIRLDLTNATVRNFMRQYQSGPAVDITQAHYIRWKFRLSEADFASAFIAFNDRVHFFARNAARPTGGTDASDTWAISATGAEQTPGSGISAGQTFYIFDNRDGSGSYNLTNLVNSNVRLVANDIYSFEVLVFPQAGTYSVTIVDQTTSNSFSSAAPHAFRALGATATNYTFLHFGTETTSATQPRPIDLDSVFISQAALPVTLFNPVRSGSTFSFSFVSQTGANHTAQYSSDFSSTNWSPLGTFAGTGQQMTVTHTNPPAAALFYRVKSALP